MTPENLLGEWARLLVGSLVASGVRHVVISPGSRSTPFTWAALAHPELSCRVLIDERSAAFYALGQAKLTGTPSALICTSGSALANYLPAVVEASLARTPLVVVSADRPYELQGCGAAQTIDQVKLFGDYVRRFTDLGMPESAESCLRALTRSVANAVHSAVFPVPGPVHVNARARKPLEPRAPSTPEGHALHERVSELLTEQPSASFASEERPSNAAVQTLAGACRSAQRGLIVCGPAAPYELEPAAITELARATGFPVLCEATSQVRFAAADREALITGFDWLCRSQTFSARAEPDLILQLGSWPTSAGLERLLSRASSAARYVLAAHDWPDPLGSARAIVRGQAQLTAKAVAEALDGTRSPRSNSPWRALWQRADELAWAEIDAELARANTLTEPSAVRAVVSALAPGSLLAVGNSLRVRELDWFCRPEAAPFGVLSQRGANGIDGVLSAACGSASVAGKSLTLLVGDISFLHDVGGLYAARGLSKLTVVVLNNRGGRIFEQLPIAQNRTANTPDLGAWLTPHELDLEHAARLYGLPFTRATELGELRAALAPTSSPGVQVIEARVSGPTTSATLELLAARIDAKLASLGA